MSNTGYVGLDETARGFIDALENSNICHDWRPYSGRGMFGEECVGIVLASEGDLYELAFELGKESACDSEVNDGKIAAAIRKVGRPLTDSMGRNIIAYWPGAKVVRS